jgi:heat shock protein HslJ
MRTVRNSGKAALSLLALAGISGLVACGSGEPEAQEDVTISPPTGQVWAWQSLSGSDPIEVATPEHYTLDFGEDGRYGIRADCNRGQGGYTFDDGRLVINPGPMTMAACPPGSYDSRFLALLSEVETATRSGDRLTLELTDGSSMLFEPLPTSAALGGTETLGGSEWEISAYNNGRGGVRTLVAATRMSIAFGEDGTVSGSSGCNTFSGTYFADGATIEIGPVVLTKKMCAAEEVMEQEEQFLAALGNSAMYEIRGDRLQFRNAEGALQVDLSR